MKITRARGIAAATLVALLWGIAIVPTRAAESDEEEHVTAPEAVLTAFHKAYPKAEIRDVSKESKDGKDYFEIESIEGKVHRDLLYLADGTVFEIEEGIAPGALPKTIADALKAKYPKGEIQKAEKITRGSSVEYEVLLENDEEDIEVVLDSNGTIKSHSVVSDEDEEAESGKADEADED